MLDTSLHFHYCTCYRTDLNEGYRVYSVCQSNNTDRAKGKIQSHSTKVISYAHKFMKYNINKGLRSGNGSASTLSRGMGWKYITSLCSRLSVYDEESHPTWPS